ncbi:MAG TPA: hypothetical protein VGE74_05415, partial [Gemmata sp.]
MGQTLPEQLRRPRTFGWLARCVLGWVGGFLFVASFLPVWTGLSDDVFFYNPGTGPYQPPFKTRLGPDGLPHVIAKTNFWRSDARQDLLAWFDILEHF